MTAFHGCETGAAESEDQAADQEVGPTPTGLQLLCRMNSPPPPTGRSECESNETAHYAAEVFLLKPGPGW